MKFLKPLNRKTLAASTIIIIAGASIAAQSGSALPNSENNSVGAALESTESEFSAFVLGSIQKNSASKSLAEWETSGTTPHDIIANAEARAEGGEDGGSKKEAFDALCKALNNLDDANLALFQNELILPKVKAELPCAQNAMARLERFWITSEFDLDAEIQAQNGQGARAADQDQDEIQPRLANEEVAIDAEKGETIYGFRREGYIKPHEIALTFDDGPHPTVTRRVLKTLRAYGVRANFFSMGDHANQWPDLDKEEIEQKHITGSHTMSHPELPKLRVTTAESEITRAREVVNDAAGVAIPFFRFPYGAHDSVLDAFVKAQKMTSFLWNMDTEDWKRPNPSDLYRKELSELDRAQGGIILMHDIHRQTAIALPHLLDELYRRGWKTLVFVPH